MAAHRTRRVPLGAPASGGRRALHHTGHCSADRARHGLASALLAGRSRSARADRPSAGDRAGPGGRAAPGRVHLARTERCCRRLGDRRIADRRTGCHSGGPEARRVPAAGAAARLRSRHASFTLGIMFVLAALLSGFVAGSLLEAVRISIWSFLDRVLLAMHARDFVVFPAKMIVIGLLVALTASLTGLTATAQDEAARLLPRAFVRGVVVILLASIALSLAV